MHFNAPSSASSSVAVLESDQLLRTLLRSIPSSQHRPEMEHLVSNNACLADQPPALASKYSGTNAIPPDSDDFASSGALQKVARRFTEPSGTCVKFEGTDPLVHVQAEAADVDELKEEVLEDDFNSNRGRKPDEEDSEMEVDCMIIAEKCMIVCSSVSCVNAEHTRRRPALPRMAPKRQYRKRSRMAIITSSASAPLSSPPVIKRRRQIKRTLAPKRRRREVPGFH